MLEECASVLEADGWLVREVGRTAALIADAAYVDVRKAARDDWFEETVRYLREFARVRPGLVRREVAAVREALAP